MFVESVFVYTEGEAKAAGAHFWFDAPTQAEGGRPFDGIRPHQRTLFFAPWVGGVCRYSNICFQTELITSLALVEQQCC